MLYLTYQVYTMDVSKSGVNQTASFKSGFLMQFINPKVVMFTLTVIPSYVMPYYTAGPVVSAFVVAVSLIGLSAYMTWAVCGSLFQGIMQNIGGRPTRSWLCFCCIRRLSYPAYRSS
ncbi:Cysteine/O-acetylserine efflux protein [Actinobacillus pleuropneumoniae]|nr:Cysteine/O-acetylserine efflux protein [Actinobacillus pleuropneumoniae]